MHAGITPPGADTAPCTRHTPRSRHPQGYWHPLGPGIPPPGSGTPWSRHPPAQCMSGRCGQQAGGMHPNGMQSCSDIRQMTTKASNVLGTIVFNSTRVNGHEKHT